MQAMAKIVKILQFSFSFLDMIISTNKGWGHFCKANCMRKKDFGSLRSIQPTLA